MVFQDPQTSLNPLNTVGRKLTETILTHGDLSHGAARKRAAELLHAVGIPAAERRIDQYPHEFSGCMRQRVVIALALCANPQIGSTSRRERVCQYVYISGDAVSLTKKTKH